MYASFFGLQHEPFSIAPDPRYLFMSERHREALAHLLYGISGGGFVLLTGEIGAGKTTVCRCFLEQIPADCNVAYIFNPKLTARELLKTVCEEYRVAAQPGESPSVPSMKDYVDRLNHFLLRAHADGRSNVLIIDEAQNLAPEVLEQLRLLTNLETSERKLLQIILIGQPELRDMLARPELEQLAQRVIARFHLTALSEAETAQYVQHRLGVAGTLQQPFERGLFKRIHRLSRGVPRRINLLCDRALLGAYAQGHARVDRRTLARAAAEVFGEDARARKKKTGASQRSWLLGALGAAGAVAVFAAASSYYGLLPSASRPVQAQTAPAVPPAPVAAVASAPAPMTIADETQLSEALFTDAAQARRALATAWGVTLPQAFSSPEAVDFCDALKKTTTSKTTAELPLQCFRSDEGLALLRLLGRPALLRLPEDAGYALLTGLDERRAILRLPSGAERRLDLLLLSRQWRGEFLTLWRAPPGGYQKSRIASEAGIGWLDQQLAKAFGEPPLAETAGGSRSRYDQELQARIAAFQRAQGLHSDGRAGPITLMQLNRAAGLDEPRLAGAPR
ncbi:AAA family ATPase [Roseateles sp. DAIF2]|uniref:ExeA family protein n=1 Tax=Roseateles sp. DAIF2 TaxID=2714952 RepID=UPI0018A2CB15|nr:ExeA family protein [Roseateles sp. DAIF2]QPF71613.1 AAA family ATPase [Roseateles sp. DAIF2]